jgi:hypothetical protein
MPNAPFFADRETIRLTRQGTWLSDGTEIDHEGTRRLFARSLFRDEQGYWLRIGPESKLIEVEDTAYFVTGLEGSPGGGYRVRLNDESVEPLDPATLRYAPGRLTCGRLSNGRTSSNRLICGSDFLSCSLKA